MQEHLGGQKQALDLFALLGKAGSAVAQKNVVAGSRSLAAVELPLDLGQAHAPVFHAGNEVQAREVFGGVGAPAPSAVGRKEERDAAFAGVTATLNIAPRKANEVLYLRNRPSMLIARAPTSSIQPLLFNL